jgi:lipopolysaccharide transport system permease protein
MTPQRTYSAASPLAEPGELISTMLSDLRLAMSVGWKLFVRGLQSRYRQSLLGYVWLLVPTIASTLVWVYLAHRRILVTGATGVPYAAYVTAGMIIFQLFVEGLTAPLRRLVEAGPVMTKTRLPHESWIVAGVLDALFAVAARSVILVAVLVWSHASVGASLLLVPVGLAATLLLALAIGLLLAPVAIVRRDILELLILACTVLFFLTPVIYPVPHNLLVRLDPVTPVLVTTRSWIVGGPVELVGFAAVIGSSLVAVLVGWVVYRVAQPHLITQL